MLIPFNCPKMVIKYEDMVYNKHKVINKLLEFFSETYNFRFSNLENKISNIIKYTNFDHLKKKEEEIGFKEAVNDSFFNIGKRNQWVNELSKEEIYEIEKNFYYVLKKFNYDIKYYRQ